jgi:hypothetical protein
MDSKSRLSACYSNFNCYLGVSKVIHTTRSTVGRVTSSGLTITPNAPFAASQQTTNCRPSTSSDCWELLNLDLCCRRASARWQGVRSGPLPVRVGECFSTMETVRVPPKSGILARCRAGTAGRLERQLCNVILKVLVDLQPICCFQGLPIFRHLY